jgi:predicted N-acyltransferase
MSGTLPPVTVTVHGALSEIAATDWDACALPTNKTTETNPFVSYAYLSALEDSLSATREEGWQPRHYALRDEGGQLLGVMPAYVKFHSQGEYVFDHGWASAFENAGGRYYPKIQGAVPFTPVPGPRFLTRPGSDRNAVAKGLLSAALTDRDRHGLSSVHVTFCTDEEQEIAKTEGYLNRTGEQFHWFNRGYDDFEAFLSVLQSRKRKLIRRERRDALQASGITVECLTGLNLTEAVWDVFYAFYQDTGSRKWGHPYLTRAFFSLIGERMSDQILLIMAKRDGRYIAGAINFIGSHALFGRQWGAIEQHPFLHFELCYYQAIDYAIQHGLRRVEAGAQGEHKLARGYEPVPTFSVHAMADPGFHAAVADFLRRERRAMDEIIAAQDNETPFNSLFRMNQSGPVDDQE